MMATSNNSREVVIILPDGKMEMFFSPQDFDKETACEMLKPYLPKTGTFSLYEWHNAHLEVGVKWRGKRAQGWSFLEMGAVANPEPKLQFNPIASEMRQISLGKHSAPVYGPVLIAVRP